MALIDDRVESDETLTRLDHLRGEILALEHTLLLHPERAAQMEPRLNATIKQYAIVAKGTVPPG